MWKKFALALIILSFYQEIGYGASPSAHDIFNQIYPLSPGASVDVAYNLLRAPNEKIGGSDEIPWGLSWYPSARNAVIVFLRSDTVIEHSSYVELYEQMESARQRYQELKESFCIILGQPIKEIEKGAAWSVSNYIFALDYEKAQYSSGLQTVNVTISFFEQE